MSQRNSYMHLKYRIIVPELTDTQNNELTKLVREEGWGISLTDAVSRVGGKFIINEAIACEVMSQACNEAVYFDLIIETICQCLRRNLPLFSDLSIFAAGIISGEIRRPRQYGKHATENYMRDLSIVTQVHRLVKAGSTATRNREGNAVSACDAVAKEMRMNYVAVEKIWNRYAHLR